MESFGHDKKKRADVIKAWTQLQDHPNAGNLGSDVGSAFDEGNLEEELGAEMAAAYEAIGERGIIYNDYQNAFLIRHKGHLIRVM